MPTDGISPTAWSFTCRLRTPIAVADGVPSKGEIPCVLDGAKVTLTWRAARGPADDDESAVHIRQVLVEIVPHRARTHVQGDGEDERAEDIMVKAVRRLVLAVRRQTNQWFLDSANPVKSYRCQVISAGRTTRTIPDSDRWRTPASARIKVSFDPGAFYGELDADDLAAIKRQMIEWNEVPVYEQLILDAKRAVSARQFDVALLFSAFAVELLLKQCFRLVLQENGKLAEKDLKGLVDRRHASDINNLVKVLKPDLFTEEEAKLIAGVLESRNLVAHRGSQQVTGVQASDSIKLAVSVQRKVEALPAPEAKAAKQAA